MHGGGGGGSFISKAPRVAHLMANIAGGRGIVRIESISGPELSNRALSSGRVSMSSLKWHPRIPHRQASVSIKTSF